jgi:hypothetical protein
MYSVEAVFHILKSDFFPGLVILFRPLIIPDMGQGQQTTALSQCRITKGESSTLQCIVLLLFLVHMYLILLFSTLHEIFIKIVCPGM